MCTTSSSVQIYPTFIFEWRGVAGGGGRNGHLGPNPALVTAAPSAPVAGTVPAGEAEGTEPVVDENGNVFLEPYDPAGE